MVKPGDGSTSQQNQRPSGVRRRMMAATTRRSLAVHLGGIAGTIADQLRDGHQSQDGESAPVERADNVGRHRRHGDRMMGWMAPERHLSARPEIIESTFDRVKYGLTT